MAGADQRRFTERYWFGHRVASDWKAGSSYQFAMQGAPSIKGKVLVSDPPRQLSYSWDSVRRRRSASGTSRVTFDLEPHGKVVKLTVTHDELDERGATLRNISGGWPMVLASLKSLLETGHGLEIETSPRSVTQSGRDPGRVSRPRKIPLARPGIEGMAMNIDRFRPMTVYTIYIASTPAKVWEALTAAEFSRKYFFGNSVEIELRVGGAYIVRTPTARCISAAR